MIRLIAFAFAICLTALPATATDRVALVIGMGEYRHIGALKNTRNDARLISDTLQSIGFDVTLALDSSSQELFDTLDRFAFRAETADLALVYYAGHGVQVDGQNFLIPVDAKPSSNREVQRASLSLDQLLRAVDGARKMRIVILDSCRDNPLGDAIDDSDTGGLAATGLAPASPDRGTLVSFAARDGAVALDGAGDNSPFATALASRMRQKGLEISLMFREVRDAVLRSTNDQQEPWTYGSLSGTPFFLAGPAEGGPVLAQFDDPFAAWAALGDTAEQQLLALADSGDTRSLLGLAYMRLNAADEDGFDPVAAARFLEKAIAAGSAEAQYELARMLEQGRGVPADPDRARALYEAAAAQDFADAINDLGFLHYQGGLGLPRDPARAVGFFRQAADLRHPQAMFNYAALIDDGLIDGAGPEAAAEYLYRALRVGATDVKDLLAERPTMFKPATRRALQGILQQNGFYDGALDAAFGPGTQRGIRRAYGLEG